MILEIDIRIEAPEWRDRLPDCEALVERAARAALIEAGVAPEGFEISVLLTDDARLRALNARFRGKDAPTNVLSFPGFDLTPPSPGEKPPPPMETGADSGFGSPGQSSARFLGDVALALQTTRREATAASIPLEAHAGHLIVHAILHLLGYDHETDVDAALMESREIGALWTLGIDNPYMKQDLLREPRDG